MNWICIKDFKNIKIGTIVDIIELNNILYPFNAMNEKNKNIVKHIKFGYDFFKNDTVTKHFFKEIKTN